ncbi:MAG: hypothetical protein RR085_12755, partial [Clostridia bacterium]
PAASVTPAPSEAPAPTELAPNRSIAIHILNTGKIHLGDSVTMEALLSGYESIPYTIVWQYSDNGGKSWNNAAGTNNGTTYTLTVSQENASWCWHVALTIVE